MVSIKRPWLVSFKGLWLGGTAIVVADNALEAQELFEKEHSGDMHAVSEVKPLPMGKGVVYYNNGDY